MTLIAEAERAEDIADAFSKFKAAVDDQAAAVTALVSELYALGSVLRDINNATFSAEYGQNIRLVEDDLAVVRSSITYTLDDVFKILGEIGNGSRLLIPSNYRQTWRDIDSHFLQEGRGALYSRLEIYRVFLIALYKRLKRRLPESSQLASLRVYIKDLLADQDHRLGRLVDGVAGMSLGPPDPINPSRSFERERPPSSPTSSRDSSLQWPPESPSSPTDTYSTAPSSISEVSTGHWALGVFGDVSSTPLPRSSESSKCYGESMPDVMLRFNDEWEELFEVVFGGGRGLVVQLYLRGEDHRARILCKSPSRSGCNWYSCYPLNVFEFRRRGPCLRLYRRSNGSSKGELWANLKFRTMERLTIFYCTLLSLRAHDDGKLVRNIQDHELEGESEFFGGKIIDDDFLHALRVLRDQDSKAVRLQASIIEGDMKRTPVWTAFITNYLVSPLWLRRAGPDVVHVNEMRRHIFSSQYSPQRTVQGEHVLRFASESDATDFVATIRDLAKCYK